MTKTHLKPSKKVAYARAGIWIAASFLSLAAGVIGGALGGMQWPWLFPMAGFVGYVLAMRRAFLMRNPAGLDLFWRTAPSSRPERAFERESPDVLQFRGPKATDASIRFSQKRPSGDGRSLTGPETT
jgi:hypothetical protein